MPDDRIRISALPAATTPSDADVLAGVQSGTTKKFSLATIKSWLQNVFVPLTRTINNKALSADITLNASDIGAQPTITANGILKGDGAGGVSAAVAGTDYGTYSKPSGGIPASDLASGVIPTVPSASTANPQMDGTAAPGSSGAWARGDHVHPSDTSRLPVYGMGENLLDNWYFLSPVNQRGQSSYTFTTATYAISRWKLNRATITLGSTGINFVWNGNMNYATFLQPNARYDAVVGRKVTLSALTADGDLYSKTITVPSSGSSETPSGDPVRFIATANSKSLGILISTTTGVVIVAVKAELGTQQTLCHNEGTDANPVWVLNEIPDYEEELIRCLTSTADSTDTYANKSLATEQQLTGDYVETGTKTSRAYSVGEHFCWNGLLYRAKTAISSGGDINPGANCESVKLTTELNNKVYWGQSSTSYNVQGCSIRKVSDSRIILTLLTGGVDASGPGTMRLDVQSTGIRFERYDGSNWVLLKQWA